MIVETYCKSDDPVRLQGSVFEQASINIKLVTLTVSTAMILRNFSLYIDGFLPQLVVIVGQS